MTAPSARGRPDGLRAALRPAVAFDMYGTLVDPASYAEALTGICTDPASIAASWRRHQLELSWLLTLMDRYEPWPAVTGYALDAALAEAGLPALDDRREDVLERASIPALYDDVPDALAALESYGYELAVFSNGGRAQLQRIVLETGIADHFTRLISVEDVGAYKPAPAVYRHAATELGRPPHDVWLVSGNPFDAAGASAAGLRVAKVERARTFRYGFVPEPDIVVAGLADLPGRLREHLAG